MVCYMKKKKINIDFIESQFIQINGWHYTIVYIFLDLKVYYY